MTAVAQTGLDTKRFGLADKAIALGMGDGLEPATAAKLAPYY
jgi:hypothetical protein